MKPKSRKVLSRAVQLPPAAEIGETLAQTFDAKADADAEEAWTSEIMRRMAEVDSGNVKLIPWPRVRRRLRASMGGGRSMV